MDAARRWVQGELSVSEARTVTFAAHVAGHARHAASADKAAEAL